MTARDSGMLFIVSTKVNSEMHQEILDHFMIASSENLSDDDFVFQRDSTSFTHPNRK